MCNDDVHYLESESARFSLEGGREGGREGGGEGGREGGERDENGTWEQTTQPRGGAGPTTRLGPQPKKVTVTPGTGQDNGATRAATARQCR